jgi:hypothetical protein
MRAALAFSVEEWNGRIEENWKVGTLNTGTCVLTAGSSIAPMFHYSIAPQRLYGNFFLDSARSLQLRRRFHFHKASRFAEGQKLFSRAGGE